MTRSRKRRPEAKTPAVVPRRAPDRLSGVAVAAILLGLYLITLCPTIYSGDAAEMATAGATFGIPHPPGYPLYSLLANLWCRLLPVGEAAWRINVLSAIFAAAAAVFLHFFLIRLRVSWTAAAPVALGLGAGHTFWSQALISEVYALDLMLAAAALYAALRARQLLTARSAALCLACVGLWLGHRNVNLIYAPVAVAIAWPALRGALGRGRVTLLLALSLLGPLLVLLYLPLASAADPMLDTGDPETWSRFWEVVLARVYRQYLQLGPSWDHLRTTLVRLPRELGLALLLLLPGLVLTWRRERAVVAAMVYLLGANLLFAACYRVPDVAVFTLPGMLAACVLAGLGLARLQALARRRAPAWLTGGAAALCAVALAAVNLGDNDLSQQTLARDFARDAVSFPGQRGLILSHVDTVSFSLWYAQYVERRRPDLLIVSRGRAVDWHQEQARRLRPDLDIPLITGPGAVSRWPRALVERNLKKVPLYVTANLGGYFSPPDAARLGRIVQEHPAGLLTRLAPAGPPRAAEVISRNQAFWRRAWPHAARARTQRLGTEMIATLLHYASMRMLFAQYCLWHGRAPAATRAAGAVAALNTAPLIAAVNRQYRRQRARYHMSEMPRLAALVKHLARALDRRQLSLAQVRQKMAGGARRPATAGSPGPAPGGVEQLNQRGIQAAQGGDLAAALKIFDRVLTLSPAHRGALFNRAKVLAMMRRNPEAIKAYEELLRHSPSSLLGLFGLAELRRTDDPAAAARLYRRAANAEGPEHLKRMVKERLSSLPR